MKPFAIVSFIAFIILPNPAFCASNLTDYFNNFYNSYLEARKVDCSDRMVLDFLHQISNSKLAEFQKLLDCACRTDETKYLAAIIEEEYKDFLENIDFEISTIPNCPLKRKQAKKFKKQHKMFMRTIANCKNYHREPLSSACD